MCQSYIKQTSKTQYVKMREAFRKIYLHHQALHKINKNLPNTLLITNHICCICCISHKVLASALLHFR